MRTMKLAPLGIFCLSLCLGSFALLSGCGGGGGGNDTLVPPKGEPTAEEREGRQKAMQDAMKSANKSR